MGEPGRARSTTGGDRAILRMLLGTHLPFLVVVWAAFAVLVTVVTVVVSLFQEVEISGWDVAGSMLRWVALFYGWWWVGQFLPVCLTHGRTRREFAVEVTFFVAVASTVLAALMTLGYGAEKVLYDFRGWGQEFQEHRIYDSVRDYPTIFLTYWVVLLIWSTMGMILKAGSGHQNEGVGLFATLPVVGLGLLSIAGTGADNLFGLGTLAPSWFGEFSPNMMILMVLGYAAGVSITWVLVRSFPLPPAGNQ
ncbi:MAG: hypothetical protein QG608_1518 [Actinomycetota bacterium]|nr:hypothetical protein [Actinomycetota bacterium]